MILGTSWYADGACPLLPSSDSLTSSCRSSRIEQAPTTALSSFALRAPLYVASHLSKSKPQTCRSCVASHQNSCSHRWKSFARTRTESKEGSCMHHQRLKLGRRCLDLLLILASLECSRGSRQISYPFHYLASLREALGLDSPWMGFS